MIAVGSKQIPSARRQEQNHAGHRWGAVVAGIQRCSVRSDILIAVVLPTLSNTIIENLWKHAIWSVMTLCLPVLLHFS